MKRILQFALLLIAALSASPAYATWTVVQSKCTGTTTTDACSAVTCASPTMTSITAGDLLVISLIGDASSTSTLSSMTNETMTVSAASHTNGGSNTLVHGYVLSAVGGWTASTITRTTGTMTYNICVSEYSSSTGSVALDTGASGGVCTGTLTTAAPVGCTITTVSGSNLVIVNILGWGGSVTGVNSPYTNFIEPNGDGIASNANTVVGTGAVFTPVTLNTGRSSGIAFKEAAAGVSASGFNKEHRLEQLEQ